MHALDGFDARTHVALHSAVALLNLPIAAQRVTMSHKLLDNVKHVRLMFVDGKDVKIVAEVDTTGDKKPKPVCLQTRAC
jgi:hypothetical protein